MERGVGGGKGERDGRGKRGGQSIRGSAESRVCVSELLVLSSDSK